VRAGFRSPHMSRDRRRDGGCWVGLEVVSADLGSERPELGESGGGGEGGRDSMGGVGSVGDETGVVGERDIGRLPWASIPFVFCILLSYFSFSLFLFFNMTN
jgi:hypothetical protein